MIQLKPHIGLPPIWDNSPFATHPPDLAIIANEGSGSFIGDSSGNGHNGSFEGNAVWTTNEMGSALQIPSGANDGVNVGQIFDTTSTTFSISGLVKQDSVNGRYVWAQWDSNKGLIVQAESNDTFSLFVDSVAIIQIANFWVNDEIQFLTATYDGDAYHLYKNGLLHTSSAGGKSYPDFSGNDNFIIGNRDAGSRQFQGSIANTFIHKPALSPAQTFALYANQYYAWDYLDDTLIAIIAAQVAAGGLSIPGFFGATLHPTLPLLKGSNL